MRSLLLLSAILLTSLTLKAQDKYSTYNYFTPQDKELVCIDGFDVDHDDWGAYDGVEDDDDDTSYVIANGVFKFQFYDGKKGISAYEHTVAIDYSQDFEIEVKIKDVHRKNIAAIYWGRDSSANNGAYLYIKYKRSMTLMSCDNIKENSPCPNIDRIKQSKSAYKSDDYNIYTIRKVDGQYYIFLNGVYCGSAAYHTISGTDIGLGGSNGSIIEYDHIKVFYLKSKV